MEWRRSRSLSVIVVTVAVALDAILISVIGKHCFGHTARCFTRRFIIMASQYKWQGFRLNR